MWQVKSNRAMGIRVSKLSKIHMAWLLVITVLLFLSCKEQSARQNLSMARPRLDIRKIEQIVGIKGTEKNGEFKIAVPQNDLAVSVDGFRIIPPMGLTSWTAFKATSQGAMVVGDLVVQEDEIGPVQQAIIASGLTVSALHNHFVRDHPKAMFMHIHGIGPVEKLALGVRAALDKVKELRAAKGLKAQPSRVESTFNTKTVDDILEHSGTMNAGVYKVTIGRPDVTLVDHEVPVSTFMGFNTWMAFQGTPEKAAVGGDFAMLEHEVAPVIEALVIHNIEVVAVHNHMTTERPRIFFLHFWGLGPVEALARGLKAGLNQITGAHPARIISVPVDKPPTLDGVGNDEVWQSAKPLEVAAKRVMPPDIGRSTRVSIQSVHTDTHIYFLASWEDSTESISHKTWIWNAKKKGYEQGPDREDMFVLAFENTGVFTADMLSGDEGVWDVWHWKAHRTNPQGYAMDKTHRYTREKPEGKAKFYTAKNGETIWIARPEDAGDTVEKQQAAPATFQGDRVPQYEPGIPSGSTADLRAKGEWADSRWTLEHGRRLDTGNADDTPFNPSRSYKMALATFDQIDAMDKASGVIVLSFGDAQAATGQKGWNFDSDVAGQPAEGWSIRQTRPTKSLATWKILTDETAPSKPNVFTLTKTENYNGTFNLAIAEKTNFLDLDLTVEVKALRGQEDQGGGPIWRCLDENNYYICRFNPLEDNFRVYKVVDGIRRQLDSARVKTEAGKWHTVRVLMVRDQITCYLDGVKLLEARDNSFKEGGMIGLWTKADAATTFDDLTINPA